MTHDEYLALERKRDAKWHEMSALEPKFLADMRNETISNAFFELAGEYYELEDICLKYGQRFDEIECENADSDTLIRPEVMEPLNDVATTSPVSTLQELRDLCGDQNTKGKMIIADFSIDVLEAEKDWKLDLYYMERFAREDGALGIRFHDYEVKF